MPGGPSMLANANAILAIPLTIQGGGGPSPVTWFILAENGDICETEAGGNLMVQEAKP